MTDVIRGWLLSGQFISIEGIELMPLASEDWPGRPLFYKSKRAEIYYLRDSNDQLWVIKKFLTNGETEIRYRDSIKPLIPHLSGFEAGYLRKVLNQASLSNVGSDNLQISEWVEKAVLMPAVSGYRWDKLVRSVSEGKQLFHRKQRIRLVYKLSEKIKWLESQNISHRDLSSTSLYIDESDDAHLVDWDKIFHHTLPTPEVLERGTSGYIAPFLVVKEDSDAQKTWRVCADRFSLALLNSEILTIYAGSPITGARGCCDQDEIYNLSGVCLTAIINTLRNQYSKAARLLERALAATSFDDCPAPAEWIDAMAADPTDRAKTLSIRSQATFVGLNKAGFTKINKSAFVKLNRNAFVKPPYRREPHET